MHLLKSVPIHLLLLVLQATIAISATPNTGSTRTLHRLVRRSHNAVVRRTHSLARDLKVAFGSVVSPRAVRELEPREGDGGPVVYCKSRNQQVLEDGGGSGVPEDKSTTATASTASSTSTRTGASSTTASQPSGTAASSWMLSNSYQGETFFRGWDFFTFEDPTHGQVDYIDEASARRDGLLEINSAGNAVMRLETTPTVPARRKSIRIHTLVRFTGGLVIMDAVHMPYGCGTWPAFWTNGPRRPQDGEIDILEGVHDNTHNQATLHTDPGCRVITSNTTALAMRGTVIDGNTDCAVVTTASRGCGIRADSPITYGLGFNNNGGGVYAMKWDSTGIAVYFFPRNSIPSDITDNAPRPDTWGTAQARYPAAGCDPFGYFREHHAIFDTTLCGDWAGAIWNVAGTPGQEESCAQRTGVSTCEEYIRANGSAFRNAYWEVRYVQIYQER